MKFVCLSFFVDRTHNIDVFFTINDHKQSYNQNIVRFTFIKKKMKNLKKSYILKIIVE